MCIYCWHHERLAVIEDETHVILEYSQYAKQRHDLTSDITDDLASRWQSTSSSMQKLESLLGAADPKDWQALGRFLARVRRTSMQLTSEQLAKQEFHTVKRAWKNEGKHVCRHGVFFQVRPSTTCPCLMKLCEADWTSATLMPALDTQLKCIVTDVFDPHSYQRLGALQAKARRRNYF